MNLFYKKFKSLILLLTFVMLSSSLLFLYSKPINSKDMTDITPTLFIHGYKGGASSFNSMIKRFERNQWGSKRMVFRISNNGQISARGALGDEQNPFIQVIFENKRSSIENQTIWLQKVMTKLYQTYGIKQVNLVGHSMGGLASANLLVTNSVIPFPRVEKLVVIGSPFKGIDNDHYFSVNYGAATIDLRSESHSLLNLIEQKGNFGDHIDVLAIAGVIDKSNSDGLVSLASALGIQDIVPANKYNQKIFYDKTATHSGLHEHLGVDKQIAAFLWQIDSN
ncbi:alpha/beta fold hydrolase [Aquibacillus saliphilus]|uniref:alpha/beta fold hydrolase n=1 Tax=Aquibacillus saliphilus TaxID=1909422 RepID=UPI001CF082DF|nr:alpha/beta fold hydrolase [Aquibacillus saliphilus]